MTRRKLMKLLGCSPAAAAAFVAGYKAGHEARLYFLESRGVDLASYNSRSGEVADTAAAAAAAVERATAAYRRLNETLKGTNEKAIEAAGALRQAVRLFDKKG